MRIRKPADLARLVKTSRQAQGRTQQEVANAAGITRQSLARIERGHGGVSFDTAILILDYLGIRLEGTPIEEAPTSAAPTGFPGIRLPESLLAQVKQGIDTSALAGFTDLVLKNVDTSGLTAQLHETLNDPSTRAALRSAIEAGDPGRRSIGEKSAPTLPESNRGGGR